MRLLLDTHIFLWAVAGSPSLRPQARRIMEQADQIYVSAASIWEIAVKAKLGKIDANAGELVDAIRPHSRGSSDFRAAQAIDRRPGAGAVRGYGRARLIGLSPDA
jgi:hypothetical protein